MEIYNRTLDLETLKKIYELKKNKEEIIIHTDKKNDYVNTLKFLNIKGIKVISKSFDYETKNNLVMPLILKGYLKETIIKYGKNEISKNKFDEYNLELLKKLDLDDYIENFTPYLIKKGYEITDKNIYKLFMPLAKNAGSFVWFLNRFFISETYYEFNEFNYNLDKNDKSIFLEQVKKLNSKSRFNVDFMLKIADQIFLNFDVIKYIELVDFDYLIYKLYGTK